MRLELADGQVVRVSSGSTFRDVSEDKVGVLASRGDEYITWAPYNEGRETQIYSSCGGSFVMDVPTTEVNLELVAEVADLLSEWEGMDPCIRDMIRELTS